MPKLTKNAIGKMGIDFGNLLLTWQDVVGPEIAQKCQIEKFAFRKDERGNATATLKVQSYFAQECQYMIPQLIEKMNRFMGYKAIADIKIKQVMVPFEDVSSLHDVKLKKALSEKDEAEIEAVIHDCTDERIHDLLRQLGEGIYSRRQNDS